VAFAVVVDLAWAPLDDDLVHQHLGSARRSTADRSSTRCVLPPDDVFHSLLHASRDCARYGLGCPSRDPLTMRYPESAVQFEHCQQIVAGPHDRALHRLPPSFGRAFSRRRWPMWPEELPAASKIAPVTSEIRDESHRRAICQIAGSDDAVPFA
jgi:hypothetical protein